MLTTKTKQIFDVCFVLFNIFRQITPTPFDIAEVLTLSPKEMTHELNADEFRVWALALNLHLLCELSDLYKDLASYSEIFHPVTVCLKSGRLPLHRYPDQLKVRVVWK